MNYTIYNILKEAQALLQKNGIQHYKLDADLLLLHILSLEKIDFIKNPNRAVSKAEFDKFTKMLEERIKGKPISKIIKKREFFSLDFKINESTLDPRADSEFLIDMSLQYFKSFSGQLRILDLGTGSGILAVTLAKYLQNSLIDACDISDEALSVARDNAQYHNVLEQVNFIKSDLFDKLLTQRYDLIISNPPYIATKEIESLEVEVRQYDPIIALDGGADGLDFYKRIAQEAHKFLKPQGKIILEIGYQQKEAVCQIFLQQQYDLLDYCKDYGNNDRCLIFHLS